MMDRRTLLAMTLSFVVLILYQLYMALVVPPPPPPAPEAVQARTEQQPGATAPPPGDVAVGKGGSTTLAPTPEAQPPVAQTPPGESVTFTNGVVRARIALNGARLTEIDFLDHLDQLTPEGKPVRLLNDDPASLFFAESGYLAPVGVTLPGRQTPWKLAQPPADPPPGQQVVRLFWDNGQGLLFQKEFHIQENAYLIQVVDKVSNRGAEPVTLYPYAQLLRIAPPPADMTTAVEDFTGPMGYLDGVRVTHPYDDVKTQDQRQESRSGWIGFNDKYFLAAIHPVEQEHPKKFYFDYDAPTHRVGTVAGKLSLQPQVETATTTSLFLGPKAVHLLEAQNLNLERSIDYGWFHFLAQPLVHVLLYFQGFTGNFALAIVLLTVIIKLLFFPLADKSYRSMEAMKKLQPKMEELKKLYGDDKPRLQQEMMKLYQENKVNPLGGCLPIAVQIPVFFALYKTLLLSVEMRHAPLGGWINDLSAHDPYYVLPILMGASMLLQTRLSPTPPDPTQAKVMQLLPIIFTFFFLQFPSGLVLYWLVNNVLSIAQQYYIMKRG